MSELETIIGMKEDCITFAGLAVQREGGAENLSLLAVALGRLMARFPPARRAIGEPPKSASPTVEELNAADPHAALRAYLLAQPQPRARGKAHTHIDGFALVCQERDAAVIEAAELRELLVGAEDLLGEALEGSKRTRGLASATVQSIDQVVKAIEARVSWSDRKRGAPCGVAFTKGQAPGRTTGVFEASDARRPDVTLVPMASKPITAAVAKQLRPGKQEHANDNELTAGAGRMLEALATFHPKSMTKAQVAHAAVLKQSGSFRNYWSMLSSRGLLEPMGGDDFRITKAGLALPGCGIARGSAETLEQRIAYWRERLSAGEQRMLDAVLASKRGLSKEQIGAAAELALSGSFRNYLSTLKTCRLIASVSSIFVPHPWLLQSPEAARA